MSEADEFAGATPGLDLSELDRVVNDGRYSSELVGLRVRNDWPAIYAALTENASLKAQVEELKLERDTTLTDSHDRIAELLADRDRLQAELDGVRAAIGAMLCGWDALPIGEHLVSRTQEWLNSDVMRNGVNGLRAALSTNAESREPTEQGGE